jgi:hypothetical protein
MTTNHDTFTRIATFAVTTKKASKADALAAVRRIMEMLDQDCRAPLSDISESDLVALYQQFMPAVSKRPKDAFGWCALAVSHKGHHRVECMQYVYSDGSRLYATDGHRLHSGPTALAAGYYDPKTRVRLDFDAQYPDVCRVIDSAMKSASHPVSIDDARIYGEFGDKSTILATIGPHEMTFNRALLVDAFALHSSGRARQADKMSAMLIEFDDDCMAMVMPVRA